MTNRFFLSALFCLAGISLCAGATYAGESSVKISDRKDNVAITGGVTAEILAEIKKEVGETKGLVFRLQKPDSNEDLAKICEAFPDMKELSIDGPVELTSIAPVAKLKDLTRFYLSGGTVADFSPLSDLTGLTNLEVRGNTSKNGMMAPDLKWMGKLTNLTRISIGAGSDLRTLVSFEGIPSLPKLTSAAFTGAAPADLTPLQALSGLKTLDLTGSKIADLTPLAGLPALEKLNLYGATVKDFSPLAECPALKELNVYATKEADYSTLGALAQLMDLQGGLTDLDDISWIPGMTGLKIYRMFAEKVTDYTPLAKTQIEDLTIWNMRAPVDLKQLSGATSLKKLKLWSVKNTSGFEGLASLANLEDLTLTGMNAKDGTAVDMAFAGSLGNLKILTLSGSEVSNFDAVAHCAKLEKVEIDSKTTGIDSLEALKKLPNLATLQVPKGAFTQEQLAGFANPNIKITER